MEEETSPASTATPVDADPSNEPASLSVSTTSAETPKSKKSAPLTKVLPSDRLTVERQIEALRAFAAVAESSDGKAITNDKAGDVVKMAAGTIVVTNAFFCDVGLLTRVDGGFTVAPEVTAFLRCEGGLSPETAPEKLRPLFEKQWFMNVLTPRLRISAMDVGAVQKVIGEECSASKEHVARIDVLIEFLCFVKCVARDGNQVRLIGAGVRPPPAPTEPDVVRASKNGNEEPTEPGLEKYSLTLNPAQKRKIYLWAPPEITAAELNRIQQWLSFQLIVTDPT